jgi:hypothetical protein
MVRAVFLSLCVLASSCTAEMSRRCKDVCARQAECEERSNPDNGFDEGECVAACAALERDRETVGQVERHVECVTQAHTCSDVVACH